MNQQQHDKVQSGQGFIAALDQSGGSTPKALELYGIAEDGYSGDDEMFTLMHEMRSRIITSPAFNGDRILGAILFEMTMDREVEGRGTADYLWNVKQVVPFLKVDKGLADEADGVQVMKPIPGLDALLARAIEKGIFGTKMRSVIKLADDAGIKQIVDQQFEIGRQILGAGLVPIIEPEVDIHSPEKAEAEDLLKAAILGQLDELGADQQVMLKLTLPGADDFYADLVAHPKRPAGRGALRRLQPRRGERPPRPQPRRRSPASPGRSPRGSRPSRATPSSTPRSTTRSAASSRRPSPDRRPPHPDGARVRPAALPARVRPSPSAPREAVRRHRRADADETATIVDAKSVIFAGFAADRRRRTRRRGRILVDEQFGAAWRPHAPAQRVDLRDAGRTQRPERTSTSSTATTSRPTSRIRPDVHENPGRYNPDGDAGDNLRSIVELTALGLAARDTTASSCSSSSSRRPRRSSPPSTVTRPATSPSFRPALMRRAMADLQAAGSRPTSGRSRASTTATTAVMVAEQARAGGRDRVGCVVLGQGADAARVEHWLRTAAGVPGYLGFAIGRTLWWDAAHRLPRRIASRERRGRTSNRGALPPAHRRLPGAGVRPPRPLAASSTSSVSWVRRSAASSWRR